MEGQYGFIHPIEMSWGLFQDGVRAKVDQLGAGGMQHFYFLGSKIESIERVQIQISRKSF